LAGAGIAGNLWISETERGPKEECPGDEISLPDTALPGNES
jgi:hypothetical protein